MGRSLGCNWSVAETFKTRTLRGARLSVSDCPNAMHSQSLFQLEDPHAMHHLMRAYPLATLVAVTREGMEANLLPLELCTEAGGATRLRGHVGREHPLVQPGRDGIEVLVVFQSPNAYISPRWYVNGQRSGRLAPSWNYAAVEARGASALHRLPRLAAGPPEGAHAIAGGLARCAVAAGACRLRFCGRGRPAFAGF